MSERRKKVSAFVVIAFIISLFATGIPAVASGTLQGVVVGQIPVIATQGPVTLASIRYIESGGTSFQTGDTISITLPVGMEFQTGLTSSNYYESTSNLAISYIFSENKRTITYTLIRSSQLTDETFWAKLPVVIIGSVPPSGNVAVSVVSSNADILGGVFNAGSYGSLSVSVNVTPDTVPVLSQYATNPQVIARTISFTENGPGGLKSGTANKVVLTLQKNNYWASASYTVQAYPALPAGVTVTAVREGPNELSLVLNGGTTTAATTFSLVNPSININSDGDVTAKITGKGQNDSIDKSIVLARIAGREVTTSRQGNVNPFEVMAGRQGQAMANIEVVEAAVASLAPGGTITFTLPSGLQFASPPSATYSGVAGTQPVIESGSGNRTITMYISTASISAGSVVVNFNSSGNILISPGYSGTVPVTVGGTSGASGSIVIANVVSPVTISALEVVDMPRGATKLTGGEIEIKESAAGTITTGVIVLKLPDGITFSSVPSLTRSEGNITFGLGTLSNNGSTLTIPINSRSTQSSKIVIGNINYAITSRWWDRGSTIEVTLEGNSLMDAAVSAVFTGSSDKLVVANAEFGTVKVSVFTIGSLTYTIGSQTMPMDQAPVIVSDRTMLPLRFVGEAIGLKEDDILWDPVKRSVTLLSGDRVAQVTIGSKTLLINGAPVEMDVAPQIMNGRTMLPIRWIGLALRVDVEWDAVKRTVTVTP